LTVIDGQTMSAHKAISFHLRKE